MSLLQRLLCNICISNLTSKAHYGEQSIQPSIYACINKIQQDEQCKRLLSSARAQISHSKQASFLQHSSMDHAMYFTGSAIEFVSLMYCERTSLCVQQTVLEYMKHAGSLCLFAGRANISPLLASDAELQVLFRAMNDIDTNTSVQQDL